MVVRSEAPAASCHHLNALLHQLVSGPSMRALGFTGFLDSLDHWIHNARAAALPGESHFITRC